MADIGKTLQDLFSSTLQNPVYLLLTAGVIAFFILLLVPHRIHKIHSEDIFVHQAWGAKWKGR